MLAAAVLLTIVMGAFCLWHRRLFWRRPEDRAVTVAVMLMPVGIVMIYPDQEYYLGKWLHQLTGAWYLNDYLSLLTLMIAVAALVRSVVLRTGADRAHVNWLVKQVNRPTIFAAGAMLALFLTSPITREDVWPGPIMDLPVGSLWSMWFIYALSQIWALGYLLWFLWVLRREANDRGPVNWFIACALTGLGTECAVIAAQYTSSLFEVRWYGTLLAIFFAIVGGLKSWTGRPKKGEEE